MRKLNKLAALTLAATMVLGAVTGCGSKEDQKQQQNTETTDSADTTDTADTDGDASADTAEATAGGELNVHVGPEPYSIDPQLNTTADGGILILHAFEGLTRYDESGEYVGGAAESWEVSEDGLVYTFKIREDSNWSDGQPVTAEDFVYGWQRLVSPETASDYNYMIDMVVNAKEIIKGEKDPSELGVKAVDEKTFEVTLTTPTVYFLEVCAFPSAMPVRKDIIEANGDSWATSPDNYVSNGAYTLSNWEHQAKMTYVKNEHYYDKENLGPDTINFILMEDQNTILSAFKNGEVIFADDMPSEEIPAMTGNGLEIIPNLGTYFFCMNTENETLKDANVRKALSLAIDRQYLVDTVLKNGATPADSYVSEGLVDADGSMFHDNAEVWYDLSAYDANVEEAQKLLADAGYPNGEGMESVEIMINPGHEGVAEAIQNMWQEKLGITSTIASNDWQVFVDTRKSGDYTVARHGWLADYNDPISFLDMWVTGGGNNDAFWSNAEYDKLISEIKASTDQNERYEKMHQAEKILGEEMPIIPLYYYTDIMLVSPKLQGMYTNPLGFKYFMYTKVAQ